MINVDARLQKKLYERDDHKTIIQHCDVKLAKVIYQLHQTCLHFRDHGRGNSQENKLACSKRIIFNHMY